ncbi:MAG: SAM-dependent methyltransferase, partial [Aeromonas sp.]
MELVQTPLTLTLFDRSAKRTLLALLANLSGGQLDLSQGDEHYRLGEPSDLLAKIVVQEGSFYRRLLMGGSIAAGELWIEGAWTSPDPVAVVRLLAR